MSVLNAPYFHDEQAAFDHVESVLWPTGPVCPHCGCTGRIGTVKPNPEKRVRYGLKRCGDCKKQFTVRIGAIFEESKLPLTVWLQAIFLLVSSKKGVSSHQLHRTLEITYKSAWFLTHRIREAMRSGDLAPFGGAGGDVAADETFIGRDPDARPTPKHANPSWVEKMKVLTLVDHSTGRARSFVVDTLGKEEIAPILRANIARETRLLTDEAPRYVTHGKMFADHQSVNHAKDEYVRLSDRAITTNTVEGYFSIFKRGMKGVYQHYAKKHLHRYMAEFDFRYSNRVALGVNDQTRAVIALQGVVGRRLTYRRAGVRGPGARAGA